MNSEDIKEGQILETLAPRNFFGIGDESPSVVLEIGDFLLVENVNDKENTCKLKHMKSNLSFGIAPCYVVNFSRLVGNVEENFYYEESNRLLRVMND